MKKHTKIYFDYFDIAYNEDGSHEPLNCELSSHRAVDIHHIHGRGKGKDVIENLMALCRDCHDKAHKNEYDKSLLQHAHNQHCAKLGKPLKVKYKQN